MLPFETTSITVAYQQRCEDRVKVVELDGGLVIVVADGAGGTGAGAAAAETAVREVTAAASLERDAAGWCEILRQTDQRIAAGESTCVVAARTAAGIVGASVGDSRAWLLHDQVDDLTSGQVRKPLLGSGAARPVGFNHPASPDCCWSARTVSATTSAARCSCARYSGSTSPSSPAGWSR